MRVNGAEGIVGRLKLNDNITVGKLDLSEMYLDVVFTGQSGELQKLGLTQDELPFSTHPSISSKTKESRLKNLVIAIDTSRSMGRGRLEFLKEQIGKLAPNIPRGTNVSVIEFNTTANQVISPTKINNARGFNRKVLKSIKQLGINKGTNLTNAVTAAESCIKQSDGFEYFNPGRNLVVLVTDGNHEPANSNSYRELYNAGRDLNRNCNASLFVVGMGPYYNLQHIKDLTGYSSGNWSHLATTTDLDASVDVFGEAIPDLINQLESDSCSVRCDAYGSSAAWATTGSIQGLPYIEDRVGIDDSLGVRELIAGYRDTATFINLVNPNDKRTAFYRLASSDDGNIPMGGNPNAPDDFGVSMNILPFDALPKELKEVGRDTVVKFLVEAAIVGRDFIAIESLFESGLITPNECSKIGGQILHPRPEKIDTARAYTSHIGRIGVQEKAKSNPTLEEGLNGLTIAATKPPLFTGRTNFERNTVPVDGPQIIPRGFSFLTHRNSTQASNIDSNVISDDLRLDVINSSINLDPIEKIILTPRGNRYHSHRYLYGFQFGKNKNTCSIGIGEQMSSGFGIRINSNVTKGLACKVERVNERALIISNSNNSEVSVNNRVISEPMELLDGDTLTIGDASFRVSTKRLIMIE